MNRHSRECKYFSAYNYYKFRDYCSFDHKKGKGNKLLESALQEKDNLKLEILALKQEINDKIEMKFKCNECVFHGESKAKQKNHMKAGPTLDNIPQMDGNDTLNEEVLEKAENSVETEIEYEIFYEQKKDKLEFENEIDRLWNHIMVNFGYDVSQVSDKHFTVKISPEIRYGTKTEDIQSVIVWPQDCSVSSISINLKRLVYHKSSGLDLPWI